MADVKKRPVCPPVVRQRGADRAIGPASSEGAAVRAQVGSDERLPGV